MSSTKPDSSPVPRRRRFRLHWLSWLVLLSMTAAMTLIIVPGSPSRSIEWERQHYNGWSGDGDPPEWTPYSYIDVDVWSHGWPREFLRRQYAQSDYLLQYHWYPVVWSSREAWPLSGKAYEFDPILLAADVVLGLAIIAIAVAACEYWRRRRHGFRFSLLDGGVLTAFVCGALGWWQMHAHAHAAEESALASLLTSRGGLVHVQHTEKYSGPDWLQRLVGNSELVPFCNHVTELTIYPSRLTKDDRANISKLRNVETIYCVGTLTPELIDSLEKLPKLKSLFAVEDRIFGSANPVLQLLVGPAEVPLLRRLTHVTTLDLANSKIYPVGLVHIAHMLRLENLTLTSPDLLIEDLEMLADCKTLKTLSVTITATPAQQKAFAAAHPNLKLNWNTPSHDPWPDPTTPAEYAWDVATVLFTRWAYEDHATAPSRENGALDFSEIRLTNDRLEQLPPEIFPEAWIINPGHSDSATAMKLIKRCTKAGSIDTRHIALTKSDIESFSFADNTAQLYVAQGPITAKEFCEIVHKLKLLQSLTIYASSFNGAEVRQIYDALLPGTLTVYKGFQDDDKESLKMDADPVPANNPFK